MKPIIASFRAPDHLWIAKTNDATVPIGFNESACAWWQAPSQRVTMKKIIALLTVLNSVFFSAGATAQNQPLACQSDKIAGLDWEKGRWSIHSFQEKRFILVQSQNGLTKESVAKALQTPLIQGVTCLTDVLSDISCSDSLGGFLYFQPKTLKGGIAQLTGTTSDNMDRRDSVTVNAFSCTPF